MKFKVNSIFNDEKENYFKIKIDDINSEKYIKMLISLINKLQISDHLEAEPEVLSSKYKNWIGRHEYFKNKDWIIHIIFSREALHLIINCNLENRKKLVKILT